MAEKHNSHGPTCIVGLGASAGGLEALDEFFEAMPPKTGLAFVVIQHLSPDYKSLMAELLSRHTNMEVKRAEEGMGVEPDCVYIIPPRKNLRLFHGKLLLSEQERNERGINLPIDVFLTSLAEDLGQRSVGIILSGTGSDGVRGLRAIKEAGGMVMAQTPESARFDGMPRAAVATGLCDFVVGVDEMPDRLVAFASHPYISQAEMAASLHFSEEKLDRIFSLIREQTKVDFTLYKQSTILRRLERRMTIHEVEDLQEYIDLMEDRPSEVQALYRELLIGVTSFYRDPEVWENLGETYLTRLFQDQEGPEARMWVAGCSTGEEAYTLAIVCCDWMERSGRELDLKIFATDIDKEAINRAGMGLFPASVATDLNPRLLTKYFSKVGENYQINRNIREMVVFAQHNLLADPPFTNLDLVSCRNLLIYLQPVLQQKVLDAFNFSLKQSGILVLGSSETVGDSANFFNPLNHKQRIYRSTGQPRRPLQQGPAFPRPGWRSPTSPYTPPLTRGRRDDETILNRLLDTLADEMVPLCIVVNSQLEVLHIIGDSQGFLRLPSGKVMNDVSRIVVDELSIPLATGLRKVFDTGDAIKYTNIKVVRNGETVLVNLKIRTLRGRQNQEQLAMFSIQEYQPVGEPTDKEPDAYDMAAASDQRIRDLEQELQFNRENLQATIEELETSNEELQATNEELLASNEELQSTNEELQSVNEELHTVNSEYQEKILELTQLNNDFDNMLSSSRIYTLFLDENLDVRKFTPDLDAIFPIMPSDLGRPFKHLRHHLQGIDPLEVVQNVVSSGEPQSVEVKADDESWYLMRVVPYEVRGGINSGIVLSLVEITQLKTTRHELLTSEHRLARTVEIIEEGLVFQDASGQITDANDAAQTILGLDLDQMTGRTSIDPRWQTVRADGSEFPGEEHPSMQTLRTGKSVQDVVMGVKNPVLEKTVWIHVSSQPVVFSEKGTVTEVCSRFTLLPADEAARYPLNKENP
jgi:two-component system CheB/CheR fusion protein